VTAKRTETPLGTLGFAALVGFTCALIVSAAVYWLRPIQHALASIDYARAMLEAADPAGGVAQWPDRRVVDAYLDFEVRIADLETGDFAELLDPAGYDYRAQLRAGERERLRYMPVYLRREGARLVGVVLPFYGRGMWSMIHGFVALDADLATVTGVSIHDLGETPGIGDRIQDPAWLAAWHGKRLYDGQGRYRFHVDSAPPPEAAGFAIDAITGATVTVRKLEQALAQWFGPEGYAPVLAILRAEGR